MKFSLAAALLSSCALACAQPAPVAKAETPPPAPAPATGATRAPATVIASGPGYDVYTDSGRTMCGILYGQDKAAALTFRMQRDGSTLIGLMTDVNAEPLGTHRQVSLTLEGDGEPVSTMLELALNAKDHDIQTWASPPLTIGDELLAALADAREVSIEGLTAAVATIPTPREAVAGFNRCRESG